MSDARRDRLDGPFIITVVMAGNRDELLEWCRLNGRKPYGRDTRYASSPAALDGMQGIEVVYYGTWHSHPYRVCMEQILARNLRKQEAREGRLASG